MIKKLYLILICTVVLNAASFEEKVINLIGYETYNENRGLINYIFKDKATLYKDGNINYIPVIERLKNNGLLNVGYSSPQNVTITYIINYDPIKSLKIVNDSMKSLGYYHFFTKKLVYNENSDLIWSVNLKTEAAIDPLMLSRELAKNSSRVIDIKKEGLTKWVYEIDTSSSSLAKAKSLIAGEKVSFRKPLKPYFIKVSNIKRINIYSKGGNQWFPSVVFYDRHLNILEIVKENSKKKFLTLRVPSDTKYIKIDDIYTLANLKRGLSVMIKE